jgi:poly-gamma-glutamate capsule biosynthesis protein CapA/YwtB (metallophosphatase superfamily)
MAESTARSLADIATSERRPGDTVIVSLHWGGNWGFGVSREERAFTHALVDSGVDIVHGHSSHHARAIEVYRNRLILYGCGDFINDYEGISGHEEYRGDIAVAYFVELLEGGAMRQLMIVPFRMERFSLLRASADDVAWLRDTLNRESRQFDLHFELDDQRLVLGARSETSHHILNA